MQRRNDIAEMVRERIKRGDWKPGKRLPSHEDLANEFECSAHTVRRAIAILRDHGFVQVVPHKGTYVRQCDHWVDPPTLPHRVPGRSG